MRSESYSRYTEGHRCRWRRLCGYHFNGKGIQTSTPSLDLLLGSLLHKCLETVVTGPYPMDQTTATKLLDPLIEGFRQTVTRTVPSDTPSDNADRQACLAEVLAHAWTRITLPWLKENFDIVSSEKMVRFPVESTTGKVTFWNKSDLVCRNKKTGVKSVHDFKSMGYWDDESSEQWHFNIQMYLGAYMEEMTSKKPEKVAEYYIHPLVKGNEKYPSPLAFPWTAPAVTPMGQPHFSLKWRKGFTRDWVYKVKKPSEFIWDLPANQLTKFVPVAGPYGTDEEMARDFIEGALTEDEYWYSNLKDIDWKTWSNPTTQALLISRFPRSYQCWDFKRLCDFHRLCFRRKGWQDPMAIGYEPRSFK